MMSDAGGGVSMESMYNGGRDSGYSGDGGRVSSGSGSSASGQQQVPRGFGNGGTTLNGLLGFKDSASGSSSSDGALARFASASALSSSSGPTSSPSLAAANANGQAGLSSTTQATPKLGSNPITTLPSFLAHYGGLSQAQSQSSRSPTISNQAPAAALHSSRVGTNSDTHGRLAKLHSSFGPGSSPEVGTANSMGINYFGGSDGPGHLAAARHASDSSVPALRKGNGNGNGHGHASSERPSQSPSDSTHRPASAPEAPPTLHALLYGSSPAQQESSEQAAGLLGMGNGDASTSQPQAAGTASFFDDDKSTSYDARGSGNGPVKGAESKEW